MAELEILPSGVMEMHTDGFRIVAIGVNYQKEEVDWSLRKFWSDPNRLLPRPYKKFLPELCKVYGIRSLFMPIPEFGTHIAAPFEFRTAATIPDPTHPVRIRVRKTDGFQPLRGDTWCMPTGGCGTLTLFHPGDATTDRHRTHWVMHCARDNLMHEPSILQAFFPMSKYTVPRPDRRRMMAHIYFPIPPYRFTHPFDHPVFGAKNRDMCEHVVATWGEQCIQGWSDPEIRKEGRMDIAEIITAQLVKGGIPAENIITVGKDIAGNPELWHTTRGPDKNSLKRNLIFVTAK